MFAARDIARTVSFDEPAGADYRLHLDAEAPIQVAVTLAASATVPAGMVFVPGGKYRLVAAARPMTDEVVLVAFAIDRYEVSNRAFREFIEAGGYERQEFWSTEVLADTHARS